MNHGTPFDPLNEALAAACYKDLSPIEYETRDWSVWSKMTEKQKQEYIKANGRLNPPNKKETRLHMTDEVFVILFHQTWGSTALGYGGMGGASMTTAYTVIIHNKIEYCVYFGGGRLAYKFNMNTAPKEQNDMFMSWIDKRNMPSVREYNLRMGLDTKETLW
jgi:hypothetical protein